MHRANILWEESLTFCHIPKGPQDLDQFPGSSQQILGADISSLSAGKPLAP